MNKIDALIMGIPTDLLHWALAVAVGLMVLSGALSVIKALAGWDDG